MLHKSPVWIVLACLFIGLPLIFIPAIPYPFEPPKVFFLRLIVITLCTIAAFKVTFRHWQQLIGKIRQSPLLLVSLIYSGILILATVRAKYVQLGLWGTPLDHHGAITTLSAIFVGLTLIWVIQTAHQSQRLLLWLMAGSVPICLYGMVQIVGLDPLPWQTDSVSILLSTLGRSNFVAAYLSILLPLTLFLAQRKPWQRSWHLWLILLLQLVTLLWTQTRAGWLASVVGTAVILFSQLPQKRKFTRLLQTTAAIGLVTLVSIAGFQQWRGATTATPIDGNSYQELRAIAVERRLLIWQETWRLLPEAGWLGYGPEQFMSVFEQQVDVEKMFDGVNTAVNDPHNILLDQLISVGYLGTAVYLILLGIFFWTGVWRGDPFSWALLGSMSAFLVQALFTPDIIPTTLLFWTLIGLMGAGKQEIYTAPTAHPNNHWYKATPAFTRPAMLSRRQIILLIIVTATIGVGLFWRGYHLNEWLRFTGDEARDLLAAFQIVQGKLFPTIGPKVHIGFGYLGPAYYYLLALPLWLMKGAPAAAGWLTVLLDGAAIGMVFLVGKRLFNVTTGWIAALLYAFSFQVIFYARWGWHPSLVPFFTFTIIYGCLRMADGEQRWFPAVMLALSLALQLHLTAVLLILPILIVVWAQRKQMSWPLFGFALIVGIYPFIPLLTFEITQGYPNVKGMMSLMAFQSSEVWVSPVGYLLDSLGTISTGDIIHKSVQLVGNGRFFTLLNLLLTLGGIFALLRYPLPKKSRWIFASWAILPPLAMAVYSGFRPDYYLISWFAVPLLLVSNLISRMWRNGRYRPLAPLLLLIILGLNLNTLTAYYDWLAERDHNYAHFYGTTLAQKEAIVELIATSAAGKPYELHFVTWAWPNHQPYAYLLMAQTERPTNMWLYEPITDENGAEQYQAHWLDPQPHFGAQNKAPDYIYIITEPDSLPLPESFQGAEKLGEFGMNGVYRMEGSGNFESPP